MQQNTLETRQLSQDYRRIEQAILYLEANHHRQPSLREVADSIGLSEYHFQRLFTRWVGISPKRFLQYLTKERAKELLRHSEDLLSTAHASGLSGPSRLHDLFVNCEAVTPGEYKNRGEGLSIVYGIHPTPFGDCLLALTERGISNFMFIQGGGRDAAVASLGNSWAQAGIVQDPASTEPILEQIMQILTGREALPLSLHLRGTNFQIKVWEALLRIPEGMVVAYEDLAAYIGMPRASRAVGAAIGRNPVPLLIPCHRVIRKNGDFGGYRWGTARKKIILGWEMAQTSRTVEWTGV